MNRFCELLGLLINKDPAYVLFKYVVEYVFF